LRNADSYDPSEEELLGQLIEEQELEESSNSVVVAAAVATNGCAADDEGEGKPAKSQVAIVLAPVSAPESVLEAISIGDEVDVVAGDFEGLQGQVGE
jgi:transcription antitermination factor NusG